MRVSLHPDLVAQIAQNIDAILEELGVDRDAIVKETMTNTVMAEALDGVIARLREGKGFGRPLAETGLYPRLATQMILVGEESGRLEEMLARVADVYDREVQAAIKRFLAVLEPALILSLAVLIGGSVMVSIGPMLLAPAEDDRHPGRQGASHPTSTG